MDLVISIAGLLLLAVHAALCARPYLRRASCTSLVAFLRHRARKLCTFAGACGEAPSDVIGKLMAQRLESIRAAAARMLYSSAAAILAMKITVLLVNIAVGKERWMTHEQTATLFVAHAVLVSIKARFVPKLLDAYYGISMLALALYVWFASPEHYLLSSANALFFRIATSLAHLKVRNVIIGNMVSLCAGCLHVWQNSQGEESDDAGNFYIYEMSTTGVVLIAVAMLRHWTLRGVNQEIQIGILKTEHSALTSLLDMVCDVVVELSGDLTIAHDSQAMAALLLRSSRTCIAGVPFCDFISNETDQCNFRDTIAASGAGPDASIGTCRIHLFDSLSNPVSVEVFFVQVSIQEDNCRYILGIRELTDLIAPLPSFQQGTTRPKRSRELARKGTPPKLDYTSFDARDLPETPVPQAPRTSEALRFPHLVPTRQDAMCHELVIAMGSWNLKVPRSCCSFHAYALNTKAMLREVIARLPCDKDFPDTPTGKQCQECGSIFLEDEFQCSTCDSEKIQLLPEPNEEI